VGSSVCLIFDEPYYAIGLGWLGGFFVCLWMYYLHEYLEQYYGMYDTNGVLYLHGFTGILGAVAGMIATGVAKIRWSDTGHRILGLDFSYIFYQEYHKQAEYQIAVMAISLGFGVIWGIVTGLVIRYFKWFKSRHEPNFSDTRDYWTPKDFTIYSKRVEAGGP
jgi:ammonia channel protein AmtB